MKKENFLSFLTKPVSRIELMIAGILVAPLILASVVSAATTISTNISTGGTLSVTGTSTLTGHVGVGTNPDSEFALKVNNSADGMIAYFTNSLSNGGYLGSPYIYAENEFGLFDAGGDAAIAVYTPDDQAFHYSNRFTINDSTQSAYFSNVNVGIGTTTPDEKLVVDGNLKVTGTTNGVKVYRALLTQTGTNAPVATVLENSLGGTLVWTRLGSGQYEGELSNAFPSGKTFLPPKTTGNTVLYRNDNSTIVISSEGDEELSQSPIEILVYP